jgi:hypothetical protein
MLPFSIQEKGPGDEVRLWNHEIIGVLTAKWIRLSRKHAVYQKKIHRAEIVTNIAIRF